MHELASVVASGQRVLELTYRPALLLKMVSGRRLTRL